MNPKAACPVSWHKLYPNIPFDRRIDYNALRLARTSIIHVAWAADKAAAQKNPLCMGLKWHLSDMHYERQVSVAGEDVCDTYARHDEGLGRGVYPVENIPFPHPQCLCYRTEVLPNLEESADALGKWARGEHTDSRLDAGFEKWKRENQKELEGLELPEGFGGVRMEQLIQMELDKSDTGGTMNLQLFAETDIERQESRSLKRAMRKYERRIAEHQKKIDNPQDYCPNWQEMTAEQQSGLKRHWQKEIRTFNENIQTRVEELRKRGDLDETFK